MNLMDHFKEKGKGGGNRMIIVWVVIFVGGDGNYRKDSMRLLILLGVYIKWFQPICNELWILYEELKI